MTLVLILDTEQAAMLKDAAMAANSLLNLRTARADPDAAITKAVALQTRKLNQIFDQIAMPAVADWVNLPGADQDRFLKMAGNFHRHDDVNLRAGIFREMFAFYVATRLIEAPEIDGDAPPA